MAKTYDFNGTERFTVDPAVPDGGDDGFVVVTKTERNARGRFEFSESVCIPAEVWRRIIRDAK